MAGNTFGEIFRITTFGESHGEALGVVIDGCPPLLEISERDIVFELARRRPGQSEFTTPRDEDDAPRILSGIFEGKTTGTPIAIIVENKNKKSADYNDIKDLFRPGHADYTYHKKYGIRDYRGGGRASARETIGRVAAGAVAKKLLAKYNVDIYAYVTQIGDIKAKNHDRNFIEKNPLRVADKDVLEDMQNLILKMKEEGDSIGAIIEVQIKNAPVGLGEPIFDKLNAKLAHAIMSIPAVKAIEFGLGFEVATMKGSQMNDEISSSGFLSNRAGGTLGGISNGEPIIFRFALKPTASILIPKRTIDIHGNEREIVTKGRHDACVATRAVPIAEAMAAITMADMVMIKNGKTLL